MVSQQILEKFIAEWTDVLKKKEFTKMPGLFATDPHLSFESPVVHTPYKRAVEIHALLGHVTQVLGDLTYTRILTDPSTSSVCMEFVAQITVDDEKGKRKIEANGVDLFRVNEEGKATELKVMIRPLHAFQALAKEMGARVLADPRIAKKAPKAKL